MAEGQNAGHMIMSRVGLKDMTFELLGHLVRDGMVVGNVLEPPHGRLVEFGDRDIVYEAFSRLQRKNIVFRGVSEGLIFITDTGVRLGHEIASVIYVPDKAKLEYEAERWHWRKLERLFDNLKIDGCNYA